LALIIASSVGWRLLGMQYKMQFDLAIADCEIDLGIAYLGIEGYDSALDA
jgi:hypothetical protein